jgi:hypothetical protein
MNKTILAASALLMVLCNLPIQAQASGTLVVGERSHHVRYTEVMVGGSRYYYDNGLYYTGGPGNYIVVEAPVGAVIYREPAHYQQVEINGGVYYKSHNTYYRRSGRSYEVVRIQDDYRHDNGHHRDHDSDHDRGHGRR